MTAYFTIFFRIELFDFETDKGFVHGDVKYQTEPSLSTYSRVGVCSNYKLTLIVK